LSIRPTPDIPEREESKSALINSSVKPASPDLILFDEEALPIDIVAELLFEDIGSIEIISISRNDIINGRDIAYNPIGNIKEISNTYDPNKIFKIPGTLPEFFENFSIKFKNHAPDVGTGPQPIYIGAENSFGCSDFPVLDRVTNTVLGCFDTFLEARNFIDSQKIKNDTVYSEQETGNIVIDVINLKKDDRVEIELLEEGFLEDDTIY